MGAVPLGRDAEPVPRAAFDFPGVLSREAIHAGIRRLAVGKATGNSGLLSEALIALADLANEPLFAIFKVCAEMGLVPKNWTCARVHPVPKIQNYRPSPSPRSCASSSSLPSGWYGGALGC